MNCIISLWETLWFDFFYISPGCRYIGSNIFSIPSGGFGRLSGEFECPSQLIFFLLSTMSIKAVAFTSCHSLNLICLSFVDVLFCCVLQWETAFKAMFCSHLPYSPQPWWIYKSTSFSPAWYGSLSSEPVHAFKSVLTGACISHMFAIVTAMKILKKNMLGCPFSILCNVMGPKLFNRFGMHTCTFSVFRPQWL